jgi:hypothetical protein
MHLRLLHPTARISGIDRRQIAQLLVRQPQARHFLRRERRNRFALNSLQVRHNEINQRSGRRGTIVLRAKLAQRGNSRARQ